ncbi:unnamed protein product [Phaeothamnion confervicola]
MPTRRIFLQKGVPAAIGAATIAAKSAIAKEDEGRAAFDSISTQTPTGTRAADAPLSDVPFTSLSSGVKFKEFRVGSGEIQVGKGNTVYCVMKGRLLNLNGVVFFDSNKASINGVLPLRFVVGAGKIVPGLEEGMMGMKKGSIRRIVVPASLGYATGPALEPQPRNPVDRNALDSVLKNPRRDASLLFDVQVERIR